MPPDVSRSVVATDLPSLVITLCVCVCVCVCVWLVFMLCVCCLCVCGSHRLAVDCSLCVCVCVCVCVCGVHVSCVCMLCGFPWAPDVDSQSAATLFLWLSPWRGVVFVF